MDIAVLQCAVLGFIVISGMLFTELGDWRDGSDDDDDGWSF